MCPSEVRLAGLLREYGRFRNRQCIGIILAEMQAATLVAQQGALHDQFRILYKVAQFQQV